MLKEQQSILSAVHTVFLRCFSTVIGDAERIGEVGEYLLALTSGSAAVPRGSSPTQGKRKPERLP